MKKIDLGQTITIIANVGIIASIIFLAVEIQQNNELLTAQTRTTRMENRKERLNVYLENPDLVQLVYKRKRGEALSEEEIFLHEALMFKLMVSFQYVFIEYKEGLIEEQDVPALSWRYLVHDFHAGFIEFWEEVKISFRPDFIAWMDENVTNP